MIFDSRKDARGTISANFSEFEFPKGRLELV